MTFYVTALYMCILCKINSIPCIVSTEWWPFYGPLYSPPPARLYWVGGVKPKQGVVGGKNMSYVSVRFLVERRRPGEQRRSSPTCFEDVLYLCQAEAGRLLGLHSRT